MNKDSLAPAEGGEPVIDAAGIPQHCNRPMNPDVFLGAPVWVCDKCRVVLRELVRITAASLPPAPQGDEAEGGDRVPPAYRLAAKQIGDLFCWCVENLERFPPMKGEWTDEIKRRLKAASAAGGGSLVGLCRTGVEMDNCPWCNAEARDTFSFACGSVRPSYVTPSPCQADKCKIGILERILRGVVETYPQRQMMLPHIVRARMQLRMDAIPPRPERDEFDRDDPDIHGH